MIRARFLRILCSVFLTKALLFGLTLTASSAPAPEPAAPSPSTTVTAILDESTRYLAAGRPPDALQTTERALAAAQAATDGAGLARAHAERARLLEILERNEEAVTAWQQSAAAWQRVGDGPGQVEALAAAGLTAQAVALAKDEQRRPLAAAHALQEAGRRAYDRGKMPAAQSLWEGAVAILEQRDPDSLALALGLNDLAVVVWRTRGPAEAEPMHLRALAIREKLAPESLAVATSLNNLGLTAHSRRDLGASREYHQRALALQEKLAPDSLDVALSLNNLGGVAVDQRNLPEAEGYFQRSLAILQVRVPGSPELTAVLGNLTDLAERKGDLAAAEEYARRVLLIWEEKAPGSPELAQALNNLGNLTHGRGDLVASEKYHVRALAIVERLDPDSPDIPALLLNLGSVATDAGELGVAAGYYRRARDFYEKRSPRSLEFAACLDRLGNVALYQSDLAEAERYHQRSLALRRELKPGSLEVAESLDACATVARVRGDLKAAMRDYRHALALREKLAPETTLVAVSLDHVAGVTRLQGDLTAASDIYQRALILLEQRAPRSPSMATCLSNLGGLAREQHDPEAARDYYLRALELRSQLAPDSLPVATILDNLGGVEHDRGDPSAALAYHQRALAVFELRAPDSLDLAKSLNNVGDAAKATGDLTLAITSLRRALTLHERIVPDSLDAAITLDNLGAAERIHGDLTLADAHHHRALALIDKLAPRSAERAVCLINLGLVARGRSDWRTAERYWAQAWQLLREGAETLTGDAARQGFGTSAASFVGELISARVMLHKPALAFATMEESRAQALQQLMAERRLVETGVPSADRTALQLALAARDRAEAALSEASAAVAASHRQLAAAGEEPSRSAERGKLATTAQSTRQQFAAAQSRYVQARVKTDQLWAAIKRRSPRSHAAPLTTAAAARVLPPGSLFVAFSVSQTEMQLFLLGSSGARAFPPTAYRLQVTAAEVEQHIRRLRTAVTDPESDPAEARAAAQELYERLFPAAARPVLLRARHLILSPDGPLWDIPFAALVTNRQGPPRYLGEQTAISYTQSLTLFAQSRRDRPRLGGKVHAVVVGDPVFDRRAMRLAAAPQALPAVRGERGLLFRDGSPPAPLPGTNAEAAEIARLYGEAPLLSGTATEAALRRQIGAADVVHLATHGYLDPLRPMSSGVLLTVPEQEPPVGQTANDGVLQAWEIYSQLALRAELVVLSACESGRGENVAGEGIVGLTRALQYSGARSIVASQWKVADESTRTLMVALHRKLRQGLPKDEALQQAMAAVRGNARTAHPYYWAPFFLSGDPANPGLGAKAAGSNLPRREVQRRQILPKRRR